MIQYKKAINILIVIFFIFLIDPAYSQSNNDSLSIKDTWGLSNDFFDQNQAMELSLEFDVKRFIKEKPDSIYFPAVVSYFTDDSIEIKKNVRVKARGEYRKALCSLPPFWINAKDSDTTDDFLSDLKKMKIVTHCKKGKENQDYLLKEYAAYKIFNIITDKSFKVRLLKIKYIDTGRENKEYTNYAFVIEPEDLLAERLNAYPLKMDEVKYTQTDTLYTTTMSIFQYMIGNTDYSIAGRHNIKLLTLKDYRKPEIYPIPYDFDFSGLVNAYYARPSYKIEIKSVTERYFYGICRDDEVYNIVLDLFREKKTEIFEFINSDENFDRQTKKAMISYLNEFYYEINQPRFLELYIKSTCAKAYH